MQDNDYKIYQELKGAKKGIEIALEHMKKYGTLYKESLISNQDQPMAQRLVNFTYLAPLHSCLEIIEHDLKTITSKYSDLHLFEWKDFIAVAHDANEANQMFLNSESWWIKHMHARDANFQPVSRDYAYHNFQNEGDSFSALDIIMFYSQPHLEMWS